MFAKLCCEPRGRDQSNHSVWSNLVVVLAPDGALAWRRGTHVLPLEKIYGSLEPEQARKLKNMIGRF